MTWKNIFFLVIFSWTVGCWAVCFEQLTNRIKKKGLETNKVGPYDRYKGSNSRPPTSYKGL